MKVYAHAKERGFVVATPNVAVAEWWRGRSDRREAVWKGLIVEPASDETMKLAGLALGKVRGATTIEAIVAAFAVARTGILYTGDLGDFEALRAFFLRFACSRSDFTRPTAPASAARARGPGPPAERRAGRGALPP